MKLYNITKGQLITLWVTGSIMWLLAAGLALSGSFFGAFLMLFLPGFLVFYTIGWRAAK